jgi:hypothetical protein
VASAGAASTAFEPINIKKINLPAGVEEANLPTFTPDGGHLLFWSGELLWITNMSGSKVNCITCSTSYRHSSGGTGPTIKPFPDGKRIFVGEGPSVAVLECAPNVINCTSVKVVPVKGSAAQGQYPALSPNGEWVASSPVALDAIERMEIGKLVKQGEEYVVTGSRVLNPTGPSSLADPSVAAWSDSAALFELKGFTHGGADVTYLQAGGEAAGNPDVWELNLATGARKRLTANPEWDEDNTMSPNGEMLGVWSTRTEDTIGSFGSLLPVRGFMGGVASGTEAFFYTRKATECPGPTWLLPAGGDNNAGLVGEPIVDYNTPNVIVTDNGSGSQKWSPDSTKLALNTFDKEAKKGLENSWTNESAKFILVAELTGRQASTPEAFVSSEPGAWAPEAANYHGALGYDGVVTLHGAGGGTVTVHEGAGFFGALNGEYSATYENYSENGTDFVNGEETFGGAPLFGQPAHITSHLTMTGANTGFTNIDVTAKNLKGEIEGTTETSYDGKTLRGPVEQKASECESILPKEPPLAATTKQVGENEYEVTVTASVAGAGANEKGTDTRPVNHALIQGGVQPVYTNEEGIARVKVKPSSGPKTLKISAGETLAPTSTVVE